MRNILTLLLFLLPLHAAELKVITWNVFNGFNGGRSADAASAWLAGQEPDIVALEELNGQTDESLAKLAGKWGHPHTLLLKKDGYPVGLTSRQPIELVARHREGFAHGCLQARCAGFDIFVVHLHPGDFRFRTREMERLTAIIKPLLDRGRRILVLGDFNSHSPADRAFLNGQTALLDRRKGPNLDNGHFDHGVIAGFLKCGLSDPSSTTAPANRTFPTRILEHVRSPELQAGFLERIDFILCDPATAKACDGLAYPADAILDTVSDHYPVIARLVYQADATPR